MMHSIRKNTLAATTLLFGLLLLASGCGGGSGTPACGVASDCPGQDTPCQQRTCSAEGTCGLTLTPAGTPLGTQPVGDCRLLTCDGAGSSANTVDDTDVPDDDGNACTDDVCTAGAPGHPPSPSGTACGAGLSCDGAGACVGCLAPADCPGVDDECQMRTCGAGVCGVAFTAAGTAAGPQAAGDCQQNQCDGAGALASANDDSDVPDDGNDCTTDVCSAGTPSNPPASAGTACGPGLTCDGAGVCVGCTMASECPGVDDECQARTCTGGACGFSFTAAGTPTAAQLAGDCQQNQCDGAGNIASATDNGDVPVDDGAECTGETCTAGVPAHPAIGAGAPCTQGGGVLCDGGGACVACLAATDCPGSDTECQARACVANTCGVSFTPAGTTTMAQTDGDCQQNQCDGAGNIVAAAANTDVPDDGLVCTADVCTAGVPSNPALPAGTVCGGSLVCDGAGLCAGCVVATDCPGVDTECQTRTCVSNTCGFAFNPAGTVTSAQTGGDCTQNQCDGAGNIVAVAANVDVPVDGLQCTTDVCSSGVPSNPPAADGSACTQSGGTHCEAGACVGDSFVVLRVGDGAAALSSAATVAQLEKYLANGTPVVGSTVLLPTAVSGANQPCTVAGTSTSEGGLARSANGAFVTMAGYSAPPGTAAIAGTTAAAFNRVVCRVSAAGDVDSSTRFDTAFSGSNVRSAVSFDGTQFWASGSNTGVWNIGLGATGGTQIMTAPANVRFLNIFGGQLFGSSGSGTFVNVFTIGVGLPTMAGQTATSLPGMPTMAGPSPYGYALFDLNPGVPGLDTLYVADDRAVASGGGIQKWTFDGTTWTLAATLNTGLTTGLRGLAGYVSGTSVVLYATTTTASANAIVKVVDDGTPGPLFTVLATAPANTAFRGIALAPN